MRVTVLGCGNAFSTENGNSCFLLEEDFVEHYHKADGRISEEDYKKCNGSAITYVKSGTRKMLVDAGWDLPHMLKRAELKPQDITDIYVSHAHADHAGGIEYLAFKCYDWVNKPETAGQNAAYLYANSGFIPDLWACTLSGGMKSLAGVDAILSTYFNVRPVVGSNTFEWCGWTCRLVQQSHIMSGSMISSTFGLFMEKPGHPTVYFVTDSQHCSPKQIEVFYRKADVVFQDCECDGVDTAARNLVFSSGVHASYAQLAGWPSANSIVLPPEVRAKMRLTHYQDFVSEGKDFFGNACDWPAMAREDGFAGFVKVGDIYEF